MTNEKTEKLQKMLAELGFGSRRELEQWIGSGRIVVNGQPAHIGQRVTGKDRIQVDGKVVNRRSSESCRVLVYNKPAGVICSRRDPEGRKSVFDDLPKVRNGRWISVGRLDIQTTGLLLLSNDGALANRMMHPSTGLDREYAVRVIGKLSDTAIQRLLDGVEIDGELHRFNDVQYYNGSGINHWYHVVLMEGKNREVRRLFDAEKLTVSRLKRVRFGPVMLPSTLPRGRIVELGHADLKALYKLLRLPLIARPERRREHRRSLLLPYPELPNLQ